MVPALGLNANLVTAWGLNHLRVVSWRLQTLLHVLVVSTVVTTAQRLACPAPRGIPCQDHL